MRSQKRFTNATFTRRVDHEAGRHRGKRAPREPAVCGSCGALYFKRRWSAAGSEHGVEREHFRPAKLTTCPACLQIQGGAPSGYVYVEGSFFLAHRGDVENLLRSEAGRAAGDNPLGRIMLWKENENGRLTLSTTTEHLAQRLGHALKKAFDGELKYDFSHENKLARVTWKRD